MRDEDKGPVETYTVFVSGVGKRVVTTDQFGFRDGFLIFNKDGNCVAAYPMALVEWMETDAVKAAHDA